MTDIVRVQASAHEVAVFIKDTPHLLLRRADILSIQAWKMTVGAAEPYFMIEIGMRGYEVTCEYDERDLWTAVLQQLHLVRVFDHRLGEAS